MIGWARWLHVLVLLAMFAASALPLPALPALVGASLPTAPVEEHEQPHGEAAAKAKGVVAAPQRALRPAPDRLDRLRPRSTARDRRPRSVEARIFETRPNVLRC